MMTSDYLWIASIQEAVWHIVPIDAVSAAALPICNRRLRPAPIHGRRHDKPPDGTDRRSICEPCLVAWADTETADQSESASALSAAATPMAWREGTAQYLRLRAA